MSPRHQLATSAYAYNAETLDGLDSSAFAAATGGSGYIQNTGSPQTANFNITGTGTAATLTTGRASIKNLNTSAPTPTVVGTSSVDNSTTTTQTIATSSSTQTGDLVMLTAYVEPANPHTVSATYGTFTPPAGATLVPGFPINTDDATMTTDLTHRLYVWYYYATANGSQNLTFTNTDSVYMGFTSISIRGGATSGNPLADAASTATSSSTASGITFTPPVSLNLSGTNNLVLWLYGDWQGGNPGSPPGYTTLVGPSNSGQPGSASRSMSSAGSTGIVTASRSDNRLGMTAALLSFRGSSGGSTTALAVSNSSNIQTVTVDSNGDTVIQTAVNSASALQVQNAAGGSIFNIDSTSGLATFGEAGILGAQLLLNGATSGGVTISVGAAVTSYTLVLPSDAGSAGQCLMNSATPGTLTWGACGGAGQTATVTLSPEYAGATFTPDGTNNTGDLSSDFCSGSSRQSINTSYCGATENHNYYEWSNTQATAQDYDIYVHYQLPSDYESGTMSNLKINGWGTTTTTEVVSVSLFSDARGTACSTGSNAVTTNATWGQATTASPLGACSPAAGDMVTFKVHVEAGQNNFALAGEVSFDYTKVY
jgi:hypothetical protein